jgi:hypothetical protein
MYMAMYYYATGKPFQRIENCHLAQAIKVLRPDHNLLPNRKNLAQGLLEKCYRSLKAKVDARLEHTSLYLITDGW